MGEARPDQKRWNLTGPDFGGHRTSGRSRDWIWVEEEKRDTTGKMTETINHATVHKDLLHDIVSQGASVYERGTFLLRLFCRKQTFGLHFPGAFFLERTGVQINISESGLK